jgi:cytoskeletal protein CcmA (bactofilin family)
MALKSFGRGTGPDGSMLPAAMPASAPAASPGGLTAFIDQGSEFEGKLSFRDTVRIDGRFRGEIASENTLIVGESGVIEASIRSKTISISGAVDGDVIASQKVVLHKTARVLHKTARVNGNVETPSLVMEDGAVLNGDVKMASADGKGALKAIDGGAPKPKAETTKSS